MAKSTPFLYEYLDIQEDGQHPLAWGVNRYARPTQPHFDIHVGLELGIVLQGRSRRLYDGSDFETSPGQFWLAGLWEPHGFEVLAPRTEHLVLGFLPQFLGDGGASGCDWMTLFNLEPSHRPQADSPHDRRLVLEVARRVQRLMARPGRYTLTHVQLEIQRLLLHFMERVPPMPANGAGTRLPQRQELLPALMLVEQRPADRLTLASAARAAHMGRSKFAATFRALMGVSFARYLQRRRLAGVMRDLRSTDRKLADLARVWGFSDAPHLVRVFRSVVGETPQAYRTATRESGPSTLTTTRMPRIAAKERS